MLENMNQMKLVNRGCQKERAANLQTLGKQCNNYNDNLSINGNVSTGDSAEGFNKKFKLGLTIFLLVLLFQVTLIILSL